MPLKNFFGALSVALGLASSGVYFVSIFRGRTRPHLFSWLLWGILTAVVAAAQWTEHAGPGSWPTASASVFCLLIALLSLKWGDHDITRGDWIALFFGLATIPLWYFTKDPLWAVLLATCIDGLGYYPTFRKGYLRPHEESAFSYALGVLSYGVAIVAMKTYSLTNVLLPAWAVVMNGMFVGLLLWRRRALSRR